jgi:diguanylate cyclase (GGDEF)-like protein
LPGDAGNRLASGDSEIGGREYRGRIQTFGGSVGPPVQLGVFQNAEELSDSVQDSRLLIGGILLGFLVLALVSSVFVVRALQGQVQQFLVAARRLGEGDFKQRVPVEGSDEFAALGEQFNSMSEQLSTQIDEVERKRRQLEEAIRRVGEAFAAGLDREGVVDLAVRTALDALGAEAGRAIPVDPEKMPAASVGATDERFVTALEAAERKAFAADPAYGVELLTVLDSTVETPEQRRPVVADIGEVHALALPLRAHLGAIGELQYVGVVSVARAANPFSREERDLFGYLASQAVVSIENVDLHETVQLQAVTDELTRLFNVRHLHDFLDGEVERSRRFGTGIGLILMDIDDFKRVNDTHGHQQGDVVLVEVARVLREHSRNIDEPARYGGEELALVLPQTDVARAGNAAERIRAAIERLRIPRLDGGAPLAVTASFGVAALPESASDKEELIAAADAALYRAKAAGKNRVEHAEPLAAPR